ncbi:MAG: DUF1080 domain-containing protein [Candidatus Hydrogenedentes bacterium]|nr:DUF1080 domain-containing protein [Candidatus Hydrogenedentota bacterium]
MKKRRTAILCLILAGVVALTAGSKLFRSRKPVPEGSPTVRPEGEGWIDLLDAEHAPGWKNITDDKDIFELKDGVLHIYGKTLLPLRYVGYEPERFSSFDLHVEFRLARRANSGVFLRAQPNDPVYRGFEVQVLDDFGHAPTKNSCGSIYDVVTPMFNMSRPAGEWNSFDISVVGQTVSITMNGWLVIQTDLSKMTTPYGKFKVAYKDLPLEGMLMFQDHGGEAWYRNVLLKKR